MDGAVMEMSLGDEEATIANIYDVSGILPTPNGLCLSPDESTLYVTDPSVRSLMKIDLATGMSTKLFDAFDPNGSEQEPNGCSVDPSGDTVWLINFNQGITAFDIATGTVGLTESWSQSIVDATPTDTNQVGDGLVQYGGKVYASVWGFGFGAGGITSSGIVFECEPPVMCTELTPVAAADMQLDLKTPDQPRLILPDLLMTRVQTFDLNATMTTMAPVTASPVTMAPVGDSMAPTTMAPVVVGSVAPVTTSPVVVGSMAPMTPAPITAAPVDTSADPVTQSPVTPEPTASGVGRMDNLFAVAIVVGVSMFSSYY